MKIEAIRTTKVMPSTGSLLEFLDKSLSILDENCVLALTSKIVALCEGRVAEPTTSKQDLVKNEADFTLPDKFKNGYIALTIKNNTLVPAAGIDKSNSSGKYVLWPADSQKTANQVRAYLRKRFGLNKVGVVITDSGAMPLRFGTLGIALGYSGFSPFKDYADEKDLFGFELKAGRANIAGGLSAAAVAVMGEGTEQTPLAVISEAGFIDFKNKDPTNEELSDYFVAPENDRLFAAFFEGIDWQPRR